MGNSIHQEIGDSIKGVNVGNSIHQESGDNSKVGRGWGVGRGVEGECGKLHSSGDRRQHQGG